LRWINVADAKSSILAGMERFGKIMRGPMRPIEGDGSPGPELAPVPAAWPAGVSVLAQAVTACRRRDEDDFNGFARMPLAPLPAFCD